MNRNKVFLLVLPAIGAAILAVLSQFSFAIGAVPITLQTFAFGLIATIFKPREAVSATLLYLLLGAIGLPVFAGGHGGFQSFLNPTAGYLLSAPLFAFITSILTHKNSSFLTILLANILGDTILFIGGIIGLNILGNLDFFKSYRCRRYPIHSTRSFKNAPDSYYQLASIKKSQISSLLC